MLRALLWQPVDLHRLDQHCHRPGRHRLLRLLLAALDGAGEEGGFARQRHAPCCSLNDVQLHRSLALRRRAYERHRGPRLAYLFQGEPQAWHVLVCDVAPLPLLQRIHGPAPYSSDREHAGESLVGHHALWHYSSGDLRELCVGRLRALRRRTCGVGLRVSGAPEHAGGALRAGGLCGHVRRRAREGHGLARHVPRLRGLPGDEHGCGYPLQPLPRGEAGHRPCHLEHLRAVPDPRGRVHLEDGLPLPHGTSFRVQAAQRLDAKVFAQV
mmetsp:Transcript_1317/g.3778  ORF Transcript_1317/g.3778 Transcript_1317/m.3778 type:complete len:269 (+) Transcript_1317:1077-1883(+)